jgi:deazaflavin-dependent oxidoreductase (nitroreductase family)
MHSDLRMKSDSIPRYRRSSWFILHVANPLIRFSSGTLGLGKSSGFRILKIKGRKSGKIYSIPVRLLELDGKRYLVALQGETFWVKNLRAQHAGQLQFANHTTNFEATELPDSEKLPVLRAYLKRWWSVSKSLTTISSPDAPEEEFIRAEITHPVFLIK